MNQVFHVEYGRTQLPLQRPRLVVGIDVAQQHDYTAIAILEKVFGSNPKKPDEIRLKYLDRWRMPYPDTLDKLGTYVSDPQLSRKVLVATDATGPGLTFYEDMYRDVEHLHHVGKERMMPVVITSGQNIIRDGRFVHVPKHYLISRLQSAIRLRSIRVPEKLPLYNVLESELEGYELKVSETSKRVTYSNNPRDGGPEHDDTILALALAWFRCNWNPPGTRKLKVIR